MKQYLKRDGTSVSQLPDLNEYVEDDLQRKVVPVYKIQLLDENLNVIQTVDIPFGAYPKEAVIKWHLLKYLSQGAVYASAQKLYQVVSI